MPGRWIGSPAGMPPTGTEKPNHDRPTRRTEGHGSQRFAPPKVGVSSPLAAHSGTWGGRLVVPHTTASPLLAKGLETPVRWAIIIEIWYKPRRQWTVRHGRVLMANSV